MPTDQQRRPAPRRYRYTWWLFIAAIVLTVIGGITGTGWVIGLGTIASLTLLVVNGMLSSRQRKGATYSSRGSLFDE